MGNTITPPCINLLHAKCQTPDVVLRDQSKTSPRPSPHVGTGELPSTKLNRRGLQPCLLASAGKRPMLTSKQPRPAPKPSWKGGGLRKRRLQNPLGFEEHFDPCNGPFTSALVCPKGCAACWRGRGLVGQRRLLNAEMFEESGQKKLLAGKH